MSDLLILLAIFLGFAAIPALIVFFVVLLTKAEKIPEPIWSEDHSKIKHGLKKIRLLRLATFFPWYSLPLVVISEAILDDFYFTKIAAAVLALWAGFSILILARVLLGLQCPRCGNLYHVASSGPRVFSFSRPYQNPFIKNCIHCKLSLHGNNLA